MTMPPRLPTNTSSRSSGSMRLVESEILCEAVESWQSTRWMTQGPPWSIASGSCRLSMLKEKNGTLPQDVTYFAGEDVEDRWNCYPWDAAAYGHSIEEHERLAQQCAGQS
mmetsp:Transcript_12545/g.19870  ORF Transcript_12545/g.19870 Transcript_12545/m.19870 type:complete len:110 (+) Transcript_12545:348-677(+)